MSAEDILAAMGQLYHDVKGHLQYTEERIERALAMYGRETERRLAEHEERLDTLVEERLAEQQTCECSGASECDFSSLEEQLSNQETTLQDVSRQQERQLEALGEQEERILDAIGEHEENQDEYISDAVDAATAKLYSRMQAHTSELKATIKRNRDAAEASEARLLKALADAVSTLRGQQTSGAAGKKAAVTPLPKAAAASKAAPVEEEVEEVEEPRGRPQAGKRSRSRASSESTGGRGAGAGAAASESKRPSRQ
jgi:exonuclease VII large subunit